MNLRPYLIGAAFGAAVVLLAGWYFWPRAIFEPAAPAEFLPSGGQVLERDPVAAAPAAIATAAREAGGILERAITITVQPRPVMPASAPAVPQDLPPPPEASAPAAPASGCECAPVTVDLGLIRMPDRTRRVVATSRDGAIIGGLDIPFDSPTVTRTTRWAAGLTVSVDMSQRRALGAFVDRDVGRLRLGLELSQRDGGTATLRAGIRF